MIRLEEPASVFGKVAISIATMTSMCAVSLSPQFAAAEEETSGGIVATQVRKQGPLARS